MDFFHFSGKAQADFIQAGVQPGADFRFPTRFIPGDADQRIFHERSNKIGIRIEMGL
jgi:hypothetical protein